MKTTGLTEYKKYFENLDPSFPPKGDGEVLFKYIIQCGQFEDPAPLIDVLKKLGIRDNMDTEEIIKILKSVQNNTMQHIALTRWALNSLIGLCEDEIKKGQGEKINKKKNAPAPSINRIQNAIIDLIFDFILKRKFGSTKKED